MASSLLNMLNKHHFCLPLSTFRSNHTKETSTDIEIQQQTPFLPPSIQLFSQTTRNNHPQTLNYNNKHHFCLPCCSRRMERTGIPISEETSLMKAPFRTRCRCAGSTESSPGGDLAPPEGRCVGPATLGHRRPGPHPHPQRLLQLHLAHLPPDPPSAAAS